MKHHTDAIKSRIKEITEISARVYVSIALKDSDGALPQTPYVVIHPSDGSDETDRLSGPLVIQRPEYTLHVVSTSYDNVAKVTGLIKQKFIQAGRFIPLDVPDETTTSLTWQSPTPVQVDTDVKRAIAYQVIEISLTQEPVS